MTDKPDLTRVWALGAPPANIEDPDITLPGKFDDGWIAEIPTFENFNFLQQLFTQALAHISEHGIIDWDSVTTYPANAWIRSTVDNGIYISKIITTNNEPSVSATQWESLANHILSYISDSSTTVKGIVELATNAETITGTDTTRAVTSAGLQAKVATTTAKGIVELATNAETITGTDTTRAVTPAGLSAAGGIMSSGVWTPHVTDGGFVTTKGQTYTTQLGTYIRIGNIVFVVCRVSLSSKGTIAGSAHITGLPVLPSFSNTSMRYQLSSSNNFNTTVPSMSVIGGTISHGEQHIDLSNTTTNEWQTLNTSALDNNFYIEMSGFYEIQ